MSDQIPGAEPERFALVLDRLNTAVLGDVLDSLGHVHCFLPPGLRPVVAGARLAGRAMPVLVLDVAGEQSRPFGKLTEALDHLGPGDVYLARASRTPAAAWGELMTTTAMVRGAAGAVIDGFHRDTRLLASMDFAVFSRGPFGQDARVRTIVADYGVPIDVEGVQIAPGDLVVGDLDGVVVVPKAVEQEVLERALVKVESEDVVRAAIADGMTSTVAFATYGVL